MRRREFIKLIGGSAAAWPLVARAEQQPMPMIGFLNAASAQSYTRPLAAFLKGLEEAGYVDGRNVAIEYRWAEGQNDRLPALAADLVRREVAVIAATSTPGSACGKSDNRDHSNRFRNGRRTSPKSAFVASFSRPGGNVTGVTQTNQLVTPKRLQLLHQLIPKAGVISPARQPNRRNV